MTTANPWKDFFEAKLDELNALDIKLNHINPDPSTSVFYLHDFLDEYFLRMESLRKNN